MNEVSTVPLLVVVLHVPTTVGVTHVPFQSCIEFVNPCSISVLY